VNGIAGDIRIFKIYNRGNGFSKSVRWSSEHYDSDTPATSGNLKTICALVGEPCDVASQYGKINSFFHGLWFFSDGSPSWYGLRRR
jgi:hypothetical protein